MKTNIHICVTIQRDQSEVGSIDCEIQPEKGMHLFCFLLFWESFNCYNFGTTGLIQAGFSAKCTSPNEDFNQMETENVTRLTSDWFPILHYIFLTSDSFCSVRSHISMKHWFIKLAKTYLLWNTPPLIFTILDEVESEGKRKGDILPSFIEHL